jgi:hypothetical protein
MVMHPDEACAVHFRDGISAGLSKRKGLSCWYRLFPAGQTHIWVVPLVQDVLMKSEYAKLRISGGGIPSSFETYIESQTESGMVSYEDINVISVHAIASMPRACSL